MRLNNYISKCEQEYQNIDKEITKEDRINIYKNYLNETDYVITKISENTLLGKETELEKYNNIIQDRIEARIKITEMED